MDNPPFTRTLPARGRRWMVAVAVAIAGALVLGATGTGNVRAVATSGGPVDLGMSILAVNITSISTIYSGDLFGPYYQINWQASDPWDHRVPTNSSAFGDGSGCNPCSGNDFAYAFPANESMILSLTLWDNQGIAGMQAVNIASTSNTWTMMFQGSRVGEKTQAVYSSSGSSCNNSCKAATVFINATVQSLLHYQTNNRYFWYQSWYTLAQALNQGLTNYCLSQLLFTPTQQKVLLAQLILAGFLLGFGGSEETYHLEDIMNALVAGAFDYSTSQLQGYVTHSYWVGQNLSVFPANGDACSSWLEWSNFGNVPSKYATNSPNGGYGYDIQAYMNALDTNLVAVNADIRVNNVPQLITDLQTVASSINTAMGATRLMRNEINGTCGGNCADIQTSVLIPMQDYLQSDGIYNAGLITALSAAGSSLRINNYPATQLASGGIGLTYGLVNKRYDAGLTVTLGMPPQAYTWFGLTGTVPSGTGFGYQGTCAAWDFCGTPALGTAGSYSFRATITDGAGDVFTIPFTWNVVNWYTLSVSSSTARLGYWKHCGMLLGHYYCNNYNYGTTATITGSYSYDATTPTVTLGFTTNAGSLSPTSCSTSSGSCAVTLTDSTVGTATITVATQGYTATTKVTYCSSGSPCNF